MVGKITRKTKGNAKKKAKRCTTRKNQRKERANPFHVGSYLTHKSLYYHLHANHQI